MLLFLLTFKVTLISLLRMERQDKGFVPIEVKKVLPSPTGCAVCLGTDEKTFVIYVGPTEGAAIMMILDGVKKSRPLTHDLIHNIFTGFNIQVEYTVINEVKDNTYFARLMLKEQNSLGKNILEVDARPSDCIAIAIQNKAPIFIKKELFEQVEDVGHLLEPPSGNEEEGDFDLFEQEGNDL